MSGQNPNKLIVDADRFDVTWPDNGQHETPLGRRLAEYLTKAIRCKGIAADEPSEDEYGYCINLEISGRAYRVWVQCEGPVGPPPSKEVWSIQIQRRLGCLGSLFAFHRINEDLEPCISIVSDIAATNELGSNAKWLTQNELTKLGAGKDRRAR